MTPLQQDLWTRILTFPIGPSDVSLSFTRRLARENAWSHAFAERVVLEYRKFILLAATAGHPVTPSEEVDQAWHLHLAYTESYWNELCGGILGRPLHHGPTKGGREEDAKFRNWYARTLESYRTTFGEPPPPDVWPDGIERFRDPAAFRRIDTSAYWMIPKRRLRRAGIAVGSLAAATTVFAAERKGAPVAVVAVLALVLLFGVVVTVIARLSGRGGGSRPGDSGSPTTIGGGCSSGDAGHAHGRADDAHGGDGGSGCGGSSGCGGGGCGGGGCGGS